MFFDGRSKVFAPADEMVVGVFNRAVAGTDYDGKTWIGTTANDNALTKTVNNGGYGVTVSTSTDVTDDDGFTRTAVLIVSVIVNENADHTIDELGDVLCEYIYNEPRTGDSVITNANIIDRLIIDERSREYDASFGSFVVEITTR